MLLEYIRYDLRPVLQNDCKRPVSCDPPEYKGTIDPCPERGSVRAHQPPANRSGRSTMAAWDPSRRTIGVATEGVPQTTRFL